MLTPRLGQAGSYASWVWECGRSGLLGGVEGIVVLGHGLKVPGLRTDQGPEEPGTVCRRLEWVPDGEVRQVEQHVGLRP